MSWQVTTATKVTVEIDSPRNWIMFDGGVIGIGTQTKLSSANASKADPKQDDD